MGSGHLNSRSEDLQVRVQVTFDVVTVRGYPVVRLVLEGNGPTRRREAQPAGLLPRLPGGLLSDIGVDASGAVVDPLRVPAVLIRDDFEILPAASLDTEHGR